MTSYLTMKEVVQLVQTKSKIDTFIIFEDKDLLFQIIKSEDDEQIVIKLNPETSCLVMSVNLNTRTSYLDSLMYGQIDKTQCSAWDQPSYGSFLLRVVDAWNIAFEVLSCKLFDAAEFTENNIQMSAALAYAKEHNGLTFYMSRGYLHQVIKHDDISTIQDAIINTNELIQKINNWWNSSTLQNPITSQLFMKNQPIRELKTIEILSNEVIPKPNFVKNFIKYYPIDSHKDVNCVSIVHNPTRFILTSTGKFVLKMHLKMRKLYKQYTKLSKSNPLAITLKKQLNENGFQVKDVNNNFDLNLFVPGPTQYILVSDLPITHLNLDCLSWKNVVEMKNYKCLQALEVLNENPNLTQDSVSTLLWANEKKPQTKKFWKRYNLEIQKWIQSQNFDSPNWTSNCEKITFSGLKCLQPILGNVIKCGKYCESHFQESVQTLISVLNSVYIVHKKEEIPLTFQKGYLSCNSFHLSIYNIKEMNAFIKDYPWPQVLQLIYSTTHENQKVPLTFKMFGNFESHIIDLTQLNPLNENNLIVVTINIK